MPAQLTEIYASSDFPLLGGRRFIVTLEIAAGDLSAAMIGEAWKHLSEWSGFAVHAAENDSNLAEAAESVLHHLASSDADYPWAVDLRSLTIRDTHTNISGIARWNE